VRDCDKRFEKGFTIAMKYARLEEPEGHEAESIEGFHDTSPQKGI